MNGIGNYERKMDLGTKQKMITIFGMIFINYVPNSFVIYETEDSKINKMHFLNS